MRIRLIDPDVTERIFQDVKTILILVVALAFWPIYPVVACTWALSDKLRPAYHGERAHRLMELNVNLCCVRICPCVFVSVRRCGV